MCAISIWSHCSGGEREAKRGGILVSDTANGAHCDAQSTSLNINYPLSVSTVKHIPTIKCDLISFPT